MMESALYVVATPIGNMGDITFRAIETLKNVAFILAEDTRVSKKILDRYEINTQLVSYRDQNHDRMIEKVYEKLSLGLSLALVSDSGTPTISDPGYKLVRDILSHGYKVVSIPGPSAVTAALSISGLPTDRFIFVGFLPKSDSKRKEMLLKYSSLDATLVLYESPNRVEKLLSQIKETISPDRHISIVNNMTKLSERIFLGNVHSLSEELGRLTSIKGEFVVLISKESKEISV